MRKFLMAVVVSCIARSVCAQSSITCESTDGHYRECRGAAFGIAVLVSELSEARCIEGVTWGTRSTGVIWVDRGCRARFTLRESNSGRRVICESQKDELRLCAADLAQAADPGSGVFLSRRLGAADCLEGDSWGYDPERDQIWVAHGCRAEFIIGGRVDPKRPVDPLEGVVRCESLNGRRTQCAADTSAGVRIIRTLDDAVCGYGHQWGFDAKGVWVDGSCRAEFAVRGEPKTFISAVVCESHDATRVHCPAETRYGVALLRRLTDQFCILGRTWDFDGAGVWVSDGCSAQFALGGYRVASGAMPATATKIVCESTDGHRHQCDVDASHGVGILRQFGSEECVLNHSWGYSASGVWVGSGCRAEFAVAH